MIAYPHFTIRQRSQWHLNALEVTQGSRAVRPVRQKDLMVHFGHDKALRRGGDFSNRIMKPGGLPTTDSETTQVGFHVRQSTNA
jgi:hypothetical protein